MQASERRKSGSASSALRPLSTSTMCSSPPGRGPWKCEVYAVIGWPVAERASSRRNTPRSAARGISFSMPMQAMCSVGSDMPRSALPSFVQTTKPPVSAMAKFTPVMPASAREERRAQLAARRPRRDRSGRSSPAAVPSRSWNSSPTSSFLMWIAGSTMWLGGSRRSCTIRSPRSVSTTSMPCASRYGLRPHSSVSIDLLFTTRARARCAQQVEHDRVVLGRVAGPVDLRAHAAARCSRTARGTRRGARRVAP